jgi:hypothetical protein
VGKSPRAADVSSTRNGQSEILAGQSFEDNAPAPDRIAQRAYARFEERGRGEGADIEDWLEAEQELRQEVSGGNTSSTSGAQNS